MVIFMIFGGNRDAFSKWNNPINCFFAISSRFTAVISWTARSRARSVHSMPSMGTSNSQPKHYFGKPYITKNGAAATSAEVAEVQRHGHDPCRRHLRCHCRIARSHKSVESPSSLLSFLASVRWEFFAFSLWKRKLTSPHPPLLCARGYMWAHHAGVSFVSWGSTYCCITTCFGSIGLETFYQAQKA